MFRIYRRLFNPPEGKKVNPRFHVATFQLIAEAEAYRALALFQGLSIDFKDNPHFSEWRYTIERDAEKPASSSEANGIQVDVSKALPTKRPISYQYSTHALPDGTCECLAFNQRYGAIRGTVEDSPKGRNLFIARITAVWPNAILTTK